MRSRSNSTCAQRNRFLFSVFARALETIERRDARPALCGALTTLRARRDGAALALVASLRDVTTSGDVVAPTASSLAVRGVGRYALQQGRAESAAALFEALVRSGGRAALSLSVTS